MLVTSIFSFFHNVFFPFRDKSEKWFYFGQDSNSSVRKGLWKARAYILVQSHVKQDVNYQLVALKNDDVEIFSDYSTEPEYIYIITVE